MTQDQAIALAESKWWENATSHEIVGFQLFENQLCMDFSAFHKAVEEVLGRPVFTHEFASSWNEQLKKEFLGEAKPRTLQDILDLIPEEKRIIVRFTEDSAESY